MQTLGQEFNPHSNPPGAQARYLVCSVQPGRPTSCDRKCGRVDQALVLDGKRVREAAGGT